MHKTAPKSLKSLESPESPYHAVAWQCQLVADGLCPDAAQQDQLLDYLELLRRWNRVCNLTAIKPRDYVPWHVADSLSALPRLRGDTLLDIGTGAGLPGLVLAIACPGRHCTLVDANAKKIRFCRHVVAELGLANVTVHHGRAEGPDLPAAFDTVISRATFKLARLVPLAKLKLRPGGRLLAMKGRYPQEELQALGEAGRCARVHALEVPGLEAARHLVEMSFAGDGVAPGTDPGKIPGRSA